MANKKEPKQKVEKVKTKPNGVQIAALVFSILAFVFAFIPIIFMAL